jgi:hypothetical protein
MDQMTGFYWLRLRAALGLEIKTGMKYSKGSILTHLHEKGITNARTKKQAWLDLNAYCMSQGLPVGKRPWTE